MIDLDEEIKKSIEKSVEVDKMWSTDEISVEYDVWEECLPDIITSVKGDTITDLNLGGTEINVKVDEAVEELIHKGLEEEIIIDKDEEAKTYMFTAIMLADSNSSIEMELYDSGASRHMSPYQYKFINFVPIQKKLLTTADGSHFEAIGKGNMHWNREIRYRLD